MIVRILGGELWHHNETDVTSQTAIWHNKKSYLIDLLADGTTLISARIVISRMRGLPGRCPLSLDMHQQDGKKMEMMSFVINRMEKMQSLISMGFFGWVIPLIREEIHFNDAKYTFQYFIPVYSGHSRILFQILRVVFKGECMDPRTQPLKLGNKCAKLAWMIRNWMLSIVISLKLEVSPL